MAFANLKRFLVLKCDFLSIEMLHISDFFEKTLPNLDNLIVVYWLISVIRAENETFCGILKLSNFSIQNVLAAAK